VRNDIIAQLEKIEKQTSFIDTGLVSTCEYTGKKEAVMVKLMRSNKLEPIQGLTNIKRLEPIPSLSPPIVSGVTINLLIAYLLHDQSLLIDTVTDAGEKKSSILHVNEDD
jgi:hypothetical protein